MALSVAPPPIEAAAPSMPAMGMRQGLGDQAPRELLREAARLIAQAGEAAPLLAGEMADIVRRLIALGDQVEASAPPEPARFPTPVGEPPMMASPAGLPPPM